MSSPAEPVAVRVRPAQRSRAQGVPARGGSGHGFFGVQEVGSGDDDRVDVVAPAQRIDGCFDVDAVVGGELFGAGAAGDGDDLGAVDAAGGIDVRAPHEAGARDSDANLCHARLQDVFSQTRG